MIRYRNIKMGKTKAKNKKNWMKLKVIETPKLSRSTKWRQTVRENNPEKYEELKKKDAKRKKDEYISLVTSSKINGGTQSRKAKLKIKEKKQRQALTQQRYRERIKAKREAEKNSEQDFTIIAAPNNINSQLPNSTSSPLLEITNTSVTKSQDSNYYKKYRNSKSRQKIQALQEKDRKRKQGKKQEKKRGVRISKKKITKSKSILSPRTFANNIDSMIEQATPNKKLELAKRNLNTYKERAVQNVICQGVKDLIKTTADTSSV